MAARGLELRLHGFSMSYRTLTGQLQEVDRSIAWLEFKALKPEDRPPQREDLVKRLTPQPSDAVPPGKRLELTEWCADLARRFDEFSARYALLDRQMAAAMERLDALEKKSLRPDERNATPVRLRIVTRDLNRLRNDGSVLKA
jgi:hypothetical protein